MKDIKKWTRKELLALPVSDWRVEQVGASIIVLPQRRRHESGFNMMQFVICNAEGVPFVRLHGGTDSVCLDGESMLSADHWMMDCLPNGLLRLFPRGGMLKTGPPLSSLFVTTVSRPA